MKNIHSTFAAQCPPRSLGPWIPPVSQSGILRIDFVTPYLSSDDSLPSIELDTSHDPDGVLQTIMGRSENKFYTEDNRVEYLRMKSEGGVHSYVFKSQSHLYSQLMPTSVEPVLPLHIRPGQLVELAVGFIVAPTGKAKLSLKRRLFSVCVLGTSLQQVSPRITYFSKLGRVSQT